MKIDAVARGDGNGQAAKEGRGQGNETALAAVNAAEINGPYSHGERRDLGRRSDHGRSAPSRITGNFLSAREAHVHIGESDGATTAFRRDPAFEQDEPARLT